MASDEVPTLYDWAGGLPVLERLTGRQHPLLAPMFAQMDASHPQRVAAFLAEVFGGPAKYSQERGGHAHMLTQHLDRKLTEAQRRRWIDLLADAADEAGLPRDPEFRSAFVAYIGWGSRLAVLNSQPGQEPVLDQPMPRWGWGCRAGRTGLIHDFSGRATAWGHDRVGRAARESGTAVALPHPRPSSTRSRYLRRLANAPTFPE